MECKRQLSWLGFILSGQPQSFITLVWQTGSWVHLADPKGQHTWCYGKVWQRNHTHTDTPELCANHPDLLLILCCSHPLSIYIYLLAVLFCIFVWAASCEWVSSISFYFYLLMTMVGPLNITLILSTFLCTSSERPRSLLMWWMPSLILTFFSPSITYPSPHGGNFKVICSEAAALVSHLAVTIEDMSHVTLHIHQTLPYVKSVSLWSRPGELIGLSRRVGQGSRAARSEAADRYWQAKQS